MANMIDYRLTPLGSLLEEIKYDNQLVKKRVATEIMNAWNTGSHIDRMGRLWVNDVSLPSILRTSYANVRYSIAGLNREEVYRDHDNVYVRGDAVQQMISYNLQNAGLIRREHYLRLSEIYLIAARDSDFARTIRAEAYENLNQQKKKLKRQRLNSIGHFRDELTNYTYLSDTEFSHIRSVALYPELALFIENGLIVHTSTHRIITNARVNDENELYDVCRENQWNTDWYDTFKNFINFVY
ncbi:hypothetical protein F895_03710 [Acinetobacter sp. CIP 64.2]|uniref:Uncharacterized protein n=2 Tax=Moraxellaceae TaxID=468 RepID=N9SIZ4_9GAMM|nr:hypothetical protein F895_03710 [Acinetobacter sp. CIP 64.2]ENX51312.1 hypothetical protein F902_04430 [Acinetobacter higginsii]